MKRTVAALLLAGILAGCGGPAPTAAPSPSALPITLTGTLTIPAMGHALATPCVPANYADVVSAQVQLYDESNTLIGATSLGPDNPAIMAGTPYICRYAFSFANVPTATFYRVKIGQHDSPAASFAQLSAAGWKYDPLTLR